MLNKRNICFDFLKIICIILVIINHSHLYITETGFLFHLFHFILFSFSKIAVPIFIMISGALLLDKNDSFTTILKKRIPRVYFACLFSSVIGIFFYKLNFVDTFIKVIFGGQIDVLYFLWYIYIIIILYLLMPFIKKMINKFSKKDYMLFFLVFLFIPSFIQFVAYVFEFDFNYSGIVGRIYNQYSFLINIGYFVFGYFAFKENYIISKRKSFILFFLGLILSLLYLGIAYLNGKGIVNLKYDNFPVVLMSISVFAYFCYYCNFNFKDKYNNMIIKFSQASFGVYLTHVYLIEFLMKTNFFLKMFERNLFFGYLVLVLFVYFSLSFLFCLIRKITFFRKIF